MFIRSYQRCVMMWSKISLTMILNLPFQYMFMFNLWYYTYLKSCLFHATSFYIHTSHFILKCLMFYVSHNESRYCSSVGSRWSWLSWVGPGSFILRILPHLPLDIVLPATPGLRSMTYKATIIFHVVLQLIQCSYSNQWIGSLYWLINCNYYLVIQISFWASLYSMSVTCLIRSWRRPLSSYCPRDTQQSLLT
jgi:hypothetical protein